MSATSSLKAVLKRINRGGQSPLSQPQHSTLATIEPPTIAGYESPVLVDVIAAKTRALTPESLTKFPGIDRIMMAVMLASYHCDRRPLRVMDFGGACGSHHSAAVPLGLPLKWAVVETPEMAAAGAAFSGNGLQFFSSIDEAKKWLGTVDLMWCSGAIQYVKDPAVAAKALIDAAASVMVWTRMAMTDGAAEMTMQVSHLADNGPGALPPQFTNRKVEYRCTTTNRAQFIAAHADYDLVAELAEPAGYIFVRQQTKALPF